MKYLNFTSIVSYPDERGKFRVLPMPKYSSPIKPLNVPHCLALAVTTAALATSSYGAVTITTQSSSGTLFSNTTWASQLKNNDLINTTTGRLSGAPVYAGGADPSMPISGLNNGGTQDSAYPSTQSTYIRSASDFTQNGGTTAIATFNLDTTSPGFTSGYNITSINSFMGLDGFSLPQSQANQTYTVSVSLVGSAAYTDIATVGYSPFANVNGTNYESYVSITDSTGVLATGVDSIRFTFLKAPGALTNTGTVIRELDVLGTAVPEPSAALLGGLGVLALLRRRRA